MSALVHELLPLEARRGPSSDFLYVLCKLTWIKKGGGNDDSDNTAALAPALSKIRHQLGDERWTR